MPIKKLFTGDPDLSTIETFLNSEGLIFIEIVNGDYPSSFITLSIEDAKEFSKELIEQIAIYDKSHE